MQLDRVPRHPDFLQCLLLISGNHFSLHRRCSSWLWSPSWTPQGSAEDSIFLFSFLFKVPPSRFPVECCFSNLAISLHFSRLFERCFMHSERGKKVKGSAVVRYHPPPHTLNPQSATIFPPCLKIGSSEVIICDLQRTSLFQPYWILLGIVCFTDRWVEGGQRTGGAQCVNPASPLYRFRSS